MIQPKQRSSLVVAVAFRLLATLKFSLFFVALLGVFLYTRAPVRVVEAATSDEINFQARLLDINGGIVDDNDYQVEFKLYDVPSGGTALWTETYTGGDEVEVKSGYLTVRLGSLQTFPNTISWDQDLYLTMNIYNPDLAAWDGEMNPRLKLTAVPFAFAAKQLSTKVGANDGTLGFSSVTNNPDILLPNIAGTNNVLLQSGTSVLTQGSVPFVDATGRLTQDNSSFFFDDTNNRLGVGNANPTTVLDISGALTQRGLASAPTLAPSDQVRTYYNTVDDNYYVSTNGGSFYEICDFSGNCSGAGESVTQSGDNVSGQVAFFTSDNNITSTSNFFWDNTNNRFSINDSTPDATVDIHANFVPATTGTTTNYGATTTVTNTVNKTAGTDNSYGQQISVTRTGATGGTINNIGLDVSVVGDNGGATTNTGLSVSVSGADTNYAALFNGGSVGIGTSTPQTILDIANATSPTIQVVDTTNNATLVAQALDSSASVGTSSNHSFTLQTNAIDRLTVTAGGQVGIGTSSTGSQLQVDATAAGTIAQILRGAASQTGDLLQFQDDSGDIHGSFGATGNQLSLGRVASSGDVSAGTIIFGDGTTDDFASTLGTEILTDDRAITLPDEDGIICIRESTECGFASSSGSGAYIQNSYAVHANERELLLPICNHQ